MLQLNVISEVIVINPKFGNVSVIQENKTHIGEASIWFFQQIIKFKRAVVIKSGETILKKTVDKPCEEKNGNKMKNLLQMAIGSSFSAAEFPHEQIKCPIDFVRNFDWYKGV